MKYNFYKIKILKIKKMRNIFLFNIILFYLNFIILEY
jgi:hypothetical protein